jgi:hypothetical protein
MLIVQGFFENALARAFSFGSKAGFDIRSRNIYNLVLCTQA